MEQPWRVPITRERGRKRLARHWLALGVALVLFLTIWLVARNLAKPREQAGAASLSAGLSADLNSDGVVNSLDFSLFLADYKRNLGQ